jgi:ribosomal protein L11 methyltransferase
MLERTQWKVVERACRPSEARGLWEAARERGAVGAVTSWGSGIGHRSTLRLFWETGKSGTPPLNAEDAQIAEDLVEEDWSAYWRNSLTSFDVSERVRLDPAWCPDCEVEDGRIALRIDPGMAFGAGDHPTTRLCARLLEELDDAALFPARVLDVGAGTGVLSLVAARLGAQSVDALDIDPFCFASCRRNARRNGLSKNIRPILLSLDLLDGHYPLVLANIVSRQLEELAPLLRQHVEPGGRIVLSGFETSQEAVVRQSVTDGFELEHRLVEDGWVAFCARMT